MDNICLTIAISIRFDILDLENFQKIQLSPAVALGLGFFIQVWFR